MRHLLLAALIGLSAMACTDRSTENADPGSNPKLPAITQTGANTFGAVINGKVMVPRNSIGYVPPGSNHYAVSYFSSNKFQDIFATDGRTEMGALYIYIKNSSIPSSLQTGDYIIEESNGAWSNDTANNTLLTARVYNSNSSQYNIYLSIANTGTITITRNDDQVISGTFSCKLKNKDNPADILEVKDGRFDFTKATINTTNFP